MHFPIVCVLSCFVLLDVMASRVLGLQFLELMPSTFSSSALSRFVMENVLAGNWTLDPTVVDARLGPKKYAEIARRSAHLEPTQPQDWRLQVMHRHYVPLVSRALMTVLT